jgi:hypothetical protein
MIPFLRFSLLVEALIVLAVLQSIEGYSHIQPSTRAKLRRLVVPLRFANINISTPSPEDAADMGVREWPQQVRNKSWSESVGEDQSVVRYILSGTGSVKIVDDEGTEQTKQVRPGSLVEVAGQADLDWIVNEDMTVLTPGYEQVGLLLGVALALIILSLVLGFGIAGV